jgi:hypothetical protein
MLIDEARIVNERLNQMMATQAVLTQMAAASAISSEAIGRFQEMIARLTDGN